MKASDLKGKTIGFAASGGLDSCTITHWLSSQGVKVICFTADLGQPDEDNFSDIKERMLASGALDFISIDLKKEIAEIGLELIQCNARYEFGYWNLTGAARQVIVNGIVRNLKPYNLNIFSHGATGRGNDQIRFQIIASMLNPNLDFYAAWRDEEFLKNFKGRKEMIDYCITHKIPIKASSEKPYSTDSNLLGLTHEGGLLEDLKNSVYEVEPELGFWPKNCPDEALTIKLTFENGIPKKLNNDTVSLIDLFSKLNHIGGVHGVGIAKNLVENRIIGVKSRGVYESPAIEILGNCYQYLLSIIVDKRTLETYKYMSNELGNRLYEGYWIDLNSTIIKSAIKKITNLVNGEITIELYKGKIQIISVKNVKNSLYTLDGSMENEGNFDHADSEGLVKILTLSARNISNAQQVEETNND